jgi:hypothetical protein
MAYTDAVSGGTGAGPSGGDPYWDNVVLLMHMDTTDFVDEKGHTVTRYGNPDSVGGKFDNALFTDHTVGDFDALRVTGTPALDFLSEDMTYEFWFKPTTLAVNQSVHIIANYFWIQATTTGAITIGTYTDAFTWEYLSTDSDIIDTDKYYHIAITSTISGNNEIFVDGVKQATRITPDYYDPGAYTLLLHVTHTDGSNAIKAYTDELRITKGVARYTADFTVPSTPFPNS